MKINEGEIDLEYTPMQQKLADMLPKLLLGELLRVMRTEVLGYYVIYCIKDVEL